VVAEVQKYTKTLNHIKEKQTKILHPRRTYPLLDKLIADDDGGLDGVGVHDLGGVVEAHVLGQVQVLVVNMLKQSTGQTLTSTMGLQSTQCTSIKMTGVNLLQQHDYTLTSIMGS
jgi:hypothetical protein